MSTALRTAPGHRLRADAAAAFDAANARRRWVLTDSERPLATQIRIFLERYMPARTGGGYYGDIRWWNGVRYVRRKGFAAAAIPGTSKHGTGLAIDVTGLGHVGSATWEAFRRDVEPHGWRHPAWAKKTAFYEPWHWEYHPALDTQLVSRPGAGTGSITTPTIPGRPAPLTPEDDMFSDEDRALLRRAATTAEAAAAGTWQGGADIIDGTPQRFGYGVLPIVTHNQALLAQAIGRIAGLEEAIKQLAKNGGAHLDLAAVTDAAEQGVTRALDGARAAIETTVTFQTQEDPA